MDREMKQAAMKIPASSRLSGRICRVRFTVASIEMCIRDRLWLYLLLFVLCMNRVKT